MSAFVVNKKHIDTLATYAWIKSVRICLPDQPTIHANTHPEQFGQELVNQNYRSVNHRYQENEKPPKYRHEITARPTEAQVLKACDCYDYQACETKDYHDTLAYAMITAIRRKAIMELPGYEEAQWEIS
jgi:hypothetical protein